MDRIDEMQEYNGGLKSYWNSRAYQKLGNGGRRARKSKIKPGGRWRQRLWRIKVLPKLKILKAISPKRFFARIHQAYVRVMFGFAGKLRFSYGGDEFGGIQGSIEKEFDERLILQLQKLLLEKNRRYAAVGVTDPVPSVEIGS